MVAVDSTSTLLMMPTLLENFGNVLLIDRARRATAGMLELYLEPALAAEWLARPPDVVANGVISWGRVTADQIDELLDLCGDEDGRLLWPEILATHAGRDGFLSLVYRAKE